MRRADYKPSHFQECVLCERPFRVLACHPRRFCSRKCYGKWQRAMLTILRNPALRVSILNECFPSIGRAA